MFFQEDLFFCARRSCFLQFLTYKCVSITVFRDDLSLAELQKIRMQIKSSCEQVFLQITAAVNALSSSVRRLGSRRSTCRLSPTSLGSLHVGEVTSSQTDRPMFCRVGNSQHCLFIVSQGAPTCHYRKLLSTSYLTDLISRHSEAPAQGSILSWNFRKMLMSVCMSVHGGEWKEKEPLWSSFIQHIKGNIFKKLFIPKNFFFFLSLQSHLQESLSSDIHGQSDAQHRLLLLPLLFITLHSCRI